MLGPTMSRTTWTEALLCHRIIVGLRSFPSLNRHLYQRRTNNVEDREHQVQLYGMDRAARHLRSRPKVRNLLSFVMQ
nr:hypothetical protein SHINE37_80002 [Rhizobiaceae bacterium]